jgi:Polysaccharide lyase
MRRIRPIAVIVVLALVTSACVLANFETAIPACFDEQEASPDRLTIAPNPNGDGNVLRVEVRSGDVAIPADVGTGKSRAEIHQTRECGDNYPVDTEWFYGWDILVPSDFPYDGSNAFQIVGQFHHRGTGSPQISVQLGIENGGPVYRIMWRELVTDPTTEIATVPFTLGEWTRFTWRIVWSTDPQVGEIELRADGIDVLGGVFRGATAYDQQPKALKIGLYRGAGVTTDNIIFYDDLIIGDSWSNVGG